MPQTKKILTSSSSLKDLILNDAAPILIFSHIELGSDRQLTGEELSNIFSFQKLDDVSKPAISLFAELEEGTKSPEFCRKIVSHEAKRKIIESLGEALNKKGLPFEFLKQCTIEAVKNKDEEFCKLLLDLFPHQQLTFAGLITATETGNKEMIGGIMDVVNQSNHSFFVAGQKIIQEPFYVVGGEKKFRSSGQIADTKSGQEQKNIAAKFLNQKHDYNGHQWTLAHIAAFHGHDHLISTLAEEGVDLRIKDEQGHTALDLAATNQKMIEAFAKEGVLQNEKSNNKSSPQTKTYEFPSFASMMPPLPERIQRTMLRKTIPNFLPPQPPLVSTEPKPKVTKRKADEANILQNPVPITAASFITPVNIPSGKTK